MTGLNFSTNPATLWNGIVKYRHRNSHEGGEGDTIQSYSDFRLSYEGFRAMVYELLFHEAADGSETVTDAEKRRRKMLYFSHPFLSPAAYLTLARPGETTIEALPLYAFVAKRLQLFRLRVELELAATVPPPIFRTLEKTPIRCPPSASSPLSNGLKQEDFENFVSGWIPHLRLVRDMPPWLRPYYVCHASRKLMFMCDTRNTGAISIDTLMMSESFSELLRMFESDAQDAIITYPPDCPVEVPALLCSEDASAEDTVPAVVISFESDGCDVTDTYKVMVGPENVELSVPRSEIYYSSASTEYILSDVINMDNWFSLPLMCRVYEHFTSLDTDEDGVLTVEELSHYSDDSFTPLAISRVFECHALHNGERRIMDYQTYLNFVIATEHAASRPAMKYLWNILDIEGTKTYITVNALHLFCKEIARELSSRQMSNVSARSILSEVIDMINPAWHEWVTFDDIVRSGQQSTVLPILLSYKNFFAYDCREQTAVTASDEFADSGRKP